MLLHKCLVCIYSRAAYQKWRLTWSGIESMCVKAVAQPNGLLFRNSHFQDTMGCCYTLITSLPQPLKRTGCAVTTCFMHKHHFLERIRNSFFCKKNTMRASQSRTRCIRCWAISENYSVYPTMVWHRGTCSSRSSSKSRKYTHTHKKKKSGSVGLTETIFDMWCGKCLLRCFGAGYYRRRGTLWNGREMKHGLQNRLQKGDKTMHPFNPPTHSLPLPPQEAASPASL